MLIEWNGGMLIYQSDIQNLTFRIDLICRLLACFKACFELFLSVNLSNMMHIIFFFVQTINTLLMGLTFIFLNAANKLVHFCENIGINKVYFVRMITLIKLT